MVSGLGRHVPRDLDKYLARAYDGEVPLPYYWEVSILGRHLPARHHPGELDATLPYPALPPEFILASAISIDELDEMLERRARKEELGG